MIPLYVPGAVGLFYVPPFFAALTLRLLGYQTLVAMLFVGETRYRVLWGFLIALLAGEAVVELAGRLRPSTWSDAISTRRRLGSSRS